jgi:hypothetical protein
MFIYRMTTCLAGTSGVIGAFRLPLHQQPANGEHLMA